MAAEKTCHEEISFYYPMTITAVSDKYNGEHSCNSLLKKHDNVTKMYQAEEEEVGFYRHSNRAQGRVSALIPATRNTHLLILQCKIITNGTCGRHGGCVSGKQGPRQHTHKVTGEAGAGSIKRALKPKQGAKLYPEKHHKNSVHSLRERPLHSDDTGKGRVGTGNRTPHSHPVQHCTKPQSPATAWGGEQDQEQELKGSISHRPSAPSTPPKWVWQN